MTTPPLATKYVFSLSIKVGTPIVAGDLGYGIRRVIPVLGGTVLGEGIKGTIHSGGADFQVIRPDGFTELEAKYAFELDDGAVVYIENIGVRFGPKDALDRIARGEAVDPALIYFRSVPKFETGHPRYRWLMQNLFIGVGARHPDRVELAVHQVL
ncbi:Protein of unknown function [Bradyrhizobium sp. NFR13]|jgi:hypothetical protein|uniref:DUF3237 domain-containing protein n=1 Tax=Bradyrhizobium sp. NFR13 TaxID=1566285 RepID=UPI0008EA5766|nr:DUF3237 domain-containing protein [Bradyrhizobium sp. NFR13]SFL74577.1 Protein of unknown function [Bradyrhizobium sp. NFR13]